MKRYWTYTEVYVKELFDRLDITTPKQLDHQQVARKLDVKVFYWSDSSQALFHNGKPYILLNDHQSREEMQEDFWHEVSHILLHTGRQDRLPEQFIQYQECKAKQFMLHAAVPTFMLQQMHLETSQTPTLHIQKTFNVTEQVAQQRLEQYLNKLHFLKWNCRFKHYVQHSKYYLS